MNLRFTQHVRERMRERDITEADVRSALANHFSSDDTPKNSVRYIGPGLVGADLKVWIVQPGLSASPAIVKSAAWKGR